jgi:Zn-dependent peptidase ImmA (M78 family)
MTGARQLLASMPDVTVRYTRDQAILKGSNARWFPRVRTVAMHADLRGRRWRSSIAHELSHAILDHPAACGDEFFDQRLELEADALAAKMLLPDLDDLARELATTCHHGHAAANLGIILDLLEVRLKYLTPAERRYLDAAVWAVHEGEGA